MDKEREAENQAEREQRQAESGNPGGGRGRRDEPGHTGVYPLSSSEGASEDAEVRTEPEWGQGERGAAGYEDSGTSEVVVIPPSGEPGAAEAGSDQETPAEG